MTTGVSSSVATKITASLEEDRAELIGLSHALHAEPELGGAEFRAVERLRAILERHGFAAGDAPEDLPTAFCYRRGSASMVVTLCVEYDALPGIGHACGHNVNAAAALGAALALGRIAAELDVTVQVLGTPAEETFGGKVSLIDSGHFDDTALAMMAHAAGHDAVGGRSLALSMWQVAYKGVAAHAAAGPQFGVNALDALVIAQTAIAFARQQLPPESVVSVITTEGGTAVNVIPEQTSASIEMRSPSVGNLRAIQDRVRACVEAGALATGCSVSIEPVGHDFTDLRQDPTLCGFYRAAMAACGRDVKQSDAAVASTDMGNVSHIVPTIHPMLGYDVGSATPHTPAFTGYGTSESADRAIVDGAFGLAVTAARAALDPEQRTRLVTGVEDRARERVSRRAPGHATAR